MNVLALIPQANAGVARPTQDSGAAAEGFALLLAGLGGQPLAPAPQGSTQGDPAALAIGLPRGLTAKPTQEGQDTAPGDLAQSVNQRLPFGDIPAGPATSPQGPGSAETIDATTAASPDPAGTSIGQPASEAAQRAAPATMDAAPKTPEHQSALARGPVSGPDDPLAPPPVTRPSPGDDVTQAVANDNLATGGPGSGSNEPSPQTTPDPALEATKAGVEAARQTAAGETQQGERPAVPQETLDPIEQIPAQAAASSGTKGQSLQDSLALAKTLGQQANAAMEGQRRADAMPRERSGTGAVERPAGPASDIATAAPRQSPNAEPLRTLAPDPQPQANSSATDRQPGFTRFPGSEGFVPTLGSLGGDPWLGGTSLPADPGSAALRPASAGSAGEAGQNLPARAATGDPGAQIAIQIQRAIAGQTQRFSIRLEPAELGRVDVQLDFHRDGQIRAAVLVERADTLDMLQRDAQSLERALKDSGADPSKLSLDFQLQGEAGQGHGQEQRAETGSAESHDSTDGDSGALDAVNGDQTAQSRPIDGLLDIRV